jgi:hypothetical protein
VPFTVDWRHGPAKQPCWPPTPEEQQLIERLRAGRTTRDP